MTFQRDLAGPPPHLAQGSASVKRGPHPASTVKHSNVTCKITVEAETEACTVGSVDITRYWWRRNSLFSKYENGILLDDEGWYSVTPEVVASHIAKK